MNTNSGGLDVPFVGPSGCLASPTSRSLLAYAIAYAGAGLKVLPLVPGGKAPHGVLVPHGFKDATTDRVQLETWWSQVPDAGVGIVPGSAGLLVVDVDIKAGATGLQTIASLQGRYGELPSTLTQRTPTGGYHYVFRLSTPGRIVGNAHRLGPGIDVRSSAGYIAVEPSATGQGRYGWIDFDPLSGERPDIATAPQWLECHVGEANDVVRATPFDETPTPISPETVEDLRSALGALNSDERGIWIKMGACLRELGPLGLDLWNDWSRKSLKYKVGECDAKWAGFSGIKAGFRAVFSEAQARGWQNPRAGGLAAEPSPEVAKNIGSDTAEPTPPIGKPLEPLPTELEPVLPFPVSALPLAFRALVTDVAELMQCPADFVAVPLLVAAASLVARKVCIRPQAETVWEERGNLWALLVGPPGAMKSPAMQQALWALSQMEKRSARAHELEVEKFNRESFVHRLRMEAIEKAAKAQLHKNPTSDFSINAFPDIPKAPIWARFLVADLKIGRAHV